MPLDYDDVRRIAITAMFSDDWLYDRMVLKGGNALRQVHRIGTRASMDIDFSLDGDIDPQELENRAVAALRDRFASAGYVVFDEKFGPRPRNAPDAPWGGYDMEFKLLATEKYKSLAADPDPQAKSREAETIWERQRKRFKVEMSKNEYCAGKIEAELDDYTIYVYPPAMIAIEKIRAICQQMPEYKPRRHPTPRGRDFYDVSCILSEAGVALNSPENQDLTMAIFAIKDVPLVLISKIGEQRDFHRTDWPAVEQAVSGEIRSFDFYFDRIVDATRKLEALWMK